MRETCERGVTSETISAWQARVLDGPDQRELDAHIPTCAACQGRLDRFTRIGLALRAPMPEPSSQAIWRSLYARILLHERGSMSRSQKIAALSGLGLMAVVVIIFALVFTLFPKHPAASVAPTATFRINPTSTPLGPTPTVAALEGWTLTSVMQSPISIAFSASSPQTGYVCGANQTLSTPNSGSFAALSLSVTHDSGRSWSAPATLPGSDFACNVAVNPQDAADLVLTEMPCDFGCTGSPKQDYFRSRDGGQTWTHLLIPQGGQAELAFTQPTSSGLPPGEIVSFAWSSSTLFVLGLSYAANNPLELYRSVNGGALAQVNLSADPTAATVMQNNQLEFEVLSLGGVIYLPLGCKGGINCPFLTTADAGATWQYFVPATTSPLGFIQAAEDNKTLLSTMENTNNVTYPVRSLDGGHTWEQLPQTPTGPVTAMPPNFATTPDGSLFVEVSVGTGSEVAVYRLAPGASLWTQAYLLHLTSANGTIQPTPYPSLVAVATNSAGQPQTIWGLLIHSTTAGLTTQLYTRPA